MAIFRIIIPVILLPVLFVRPLLAQTLTVTGIVKDLKGVPVPSASIQVKNSSWGAMADSLGAFSIGADPKASLIISAIGFADTIVGINGQTHIAVFLRAREGDMLNNAVVKAADKNTALPSPEETAREQIIAVTLEDFARGALFSNGIYTASGYDPRTNGAGSVIHTIIPGFGALNSLNAGEMVPVITHKEATKGSRYLLDGWANGIIVDQDNHILNDSSRLLNYDKIDGKLLIAQDEHAQKFMEVDREKVKAFAFRTKDTSFVFLKVSAIDPESYFILIAQGERYSVFRSLKTKFVRSDYRSNGLVETGNNFDEYTDVGAFYWVDLKNNSARAFVLKKKSVREALPGKSDIVDGYFTAHKHDDINEGFVKRLVHVLDQ